MPGYHDDDDRDLPQDIDLEQDDDDEDLRECLACGGEFHYDSPRCPHCGEWIFTAAASDTEAARRSQGWFWPVMVAVLIAIILVMWHGIRL
jgi:predicted RNA-binding Zn-ribbon protein involved in translation (DUF1610 family)